MNLEDRIKLNWKVDALLITDEDGTTYTTDEAQKLLALTSDLQEEEDYDEELNPVARTEWQQQFKCKILPNSSASKVTSNDGKDYIYSYEVFMRKPKQLTLLPIENDLVHITKKDGTIDKDCRCIGFVTLRNWVKLWLK